MVWEAKQLTDHLAKNDLLVDGRVVYDNVPAFDQLPTSAYVSSTCFPRDF